MKNLFLWSIAVVALCALAALYFWPPENGGTPKPRAVAVPEAATEPAVRYPVDLDQSGPPLPALTDSDEALTSALAALFVPKSLPKFFFLNDIIHRIVATVDNLPRDHVAAQLMPVKTVGGLLATEDTATGLVLSPQNAARYQAYVIVAEQIPTDTLVALYARFYPLFQQEYEQLGYPGKYFNDRLVEVIDHLLATPDEPEPLQIVQPRVLYEFADPRLENLSAGQKILLRIGKANRDKLKTKLRELREKVTQLGTLQ